MSKITTDTPKQNNKHDPDDIRWELRFAELKYFKKLFGHCNVSQKGDYRSLGVWCVRQRMLKKHRPLRLIEDRVKKLTKVGFIWDIPEWIFQTHYAGLKKFYYTNNHCLVSPTTNKTLWNWSVMLRVHYNRKSPRLTPERIRLLNQIGFDWYPLDTEWKNRIVELKKFISDHGCFPDFTYKKEYPSFIVWINSVRKLWREGKLNKTRIRELDKLNFIWEPEEEKWEQKFAELVKYKKKFGDCKVSLGKKRGNYSNLGQWLSNLRDHYYAQDGLISKKHIDRLNLLDPSWKIRLKNGEYKKVGKENLIEDLKKLKKKLGRVPTTKDVENYGNYNPLTYYNYFGSFKTAINEAGFDKPEHNKKHIGKNILLKELKRIEKKVKRTPAYDDILNHSKYSITTYRNYFGGLKQARIEAGLQAELK